MSKAYLTLVLKFVYGISGQSYKALYDRNL